MGYMARNEESRVPRMSETRHDFQLPLKESTANERYPALATIRQLLTQSGLPIGELTLHDTTFAYQPDQPKISVQLSERFTSTAPYFISIHILEPRRLLVLCVVDTRKEHDAQQAQLLAETEILASVARQLNIPESPTELSLFIYDTAKLSSTTMLAEALQRLHPVAAPVQEVVTTHEISSVVMDASCPNPNRFTGYLRRLSQAYLEATGKPLVFSSFVNQTIIEGRVRVTTLTASEVDPVTQKTVELQVVLVPQPRRDALRYPGFVASIEDELAAVQIQLPQKVSRYFSDAGMTVLLANPNQIIAPAVVNIFKHAILLQRLRQHQAGSSVEGPDLIETNLEEIAHQLSGLAVVEAVTHTLSSEIPGQEQHCFRLTLVDGQTYTVILCARSNQVSNIPSLHKYLKKAHQLPYDLSEFLALLEAQNKLVLINSGIKLGYDTIMLIRAAVEKAVADRVLATHEITQFVPTFVTTSLVQLGFELGWPVTGDAGENNLGSLQHRQSESRPVYLKVRKNGKLYRAVYVSKEQLAAEEQPSSLVWFSKQLGISVEETEKYLKAKKILLIVGNAGSAKLDMTDSATNSLLTAMI